MCFELFRPLYSTPASTIHVTCPSQTTLLHTTNTSPMSSSPLTHSLLLRHHKLVPNHDPSIPSLNSNSTVARVSWPGRSRREMQGGCGRRRVRYRIRKVEKGV